VIREAAADVLAEREHALVGDRVVGVVAALRTPDDPFLAEDAEVLGDVLLRRADRVGQLLHARFPLAEQVEQLDPRRVGEHVEAARDQLNQVVGERAVNVKPPLPLIVAPRGARDIRRGADPSCGQLLNRVVVRNRFRVRPDDRREGRREAVRAPKEVKAVSRKRIVILGGGTGGTMAANRLRRRFDAHEAEIHVVDRDDKHVYQPGLLFVPFGMAQLEEIVRPRRRQLRNGIIFHENEVAEVWTERDELLLDDGTVLPYDLLVVASGVRLQPEETEGLTGPGWNERVFTFYSPEGADGLRGALERFGGGRLVVNLVDMPIKCPVAPLEFAFLADWYLRERGIRSRTELVYATPLDGAFTKPIASKQLAGLLAEKEIELVTEFNAGEVDGIGGKLSSYDGRELEFDLLVTIPLHGGGAYVERSPGLGDALGFVPTDKRTLQTPARPNVFALGDATDLPTSKAGSVTHFEAEVLTENVARYFADKELDTSYDGHANCFIETGFQKALLIDFNYETEPLPGHFPTAFGLPLLRESRLNHLGKLAFQWVYWHALLPGREIPGIGPAMPTAGKKRVPVHAS
jgi:sulfide:quinone oxidoreductase